MTKRDKRRDRVKLVLAGLFIVVGFCLEMFLLLAMLPRYPEWVTMGIVAVSLPGLVWLAFLMFDRPRNERPLDRDAVSRLEADGMILSETFRALRAFRVDEEDEEPSYYLELKDGRVLFMSGLYLLTPTQTRRFPCTDFVVSRHRKEGYAVDLVCKGIGLDPEVSEFSTYDRPGDGQIISGKSHDQLRTSVS